jgi:hypothetical protein
VDGLEVYPYLRYRWPTVVSHLVGRQSIGPLVFLDLELTYIGLTCSGTKASIAPGKMRIPDLPFFFDELIISISNLCDSRCSAYPSIVSTLSDEFSSEFDNRELPRVHRDQLFQRHVGDFRPCVYHEPL